MEIGRSDRRTAMQTKERLVRGLELFAQCSRAELEWVLKHADEIRLRRGTTITTRGSRAREFLVVIDGVVTSTSDGEVAVLGRGATIGGAEITDDRRHAATIAAASDVRVLVFEARVYRSFAESAPSVVRTLSSGTQTPVSVLVHAGRGRRLAVAS
jgi:CRP-like cAMP-binding protein